MPVAPDSKYNFLQNTVSLEILDLSHNQLGDKCAERIGAALAENNTLVEINLSWNHIKSRGAKGLSKAMMVSHCHE